MRIDADAPETTAAKAGHTNAGHTNAGHTNAQYNLGVLLATLLDPPELVEACRWLTTAAKAGIDEAVEARSRL
jgi:TPR repeat protein